jgi:hypothetical protein
MCARAGSKVHSHLLVSFPGRQVGAQVILCKNMSPTLSNGSRGVVIGFVSFAPDAAKDMGFLDSTSIQLFVGKEQQQQQQQKTKKQKKLTRH